MSRFQHNRDNVLDSSERTNSARKCLAILAEGTREMKSKDQFFYNSQVEKAEYVTYCPSENELQWLRDLVSRYST